jgi:hypothetical protein
MAPATGRTACPAGRLTLRPGFPAPPLPWPSLHAMSERDLRDIHAFLRGPDPKSGPAPADLSPGREPATPSILFVVQQPNR